MSSTIVNDIETEAPVSCSSVDAVGGEPEVGSGSVSNMKELENDRALNILRESVCLFEDMQRGCAWENRGTHLEEVSKLTGVSPAIVLYGYKHGTLEAHRLFLKDEFKGKDVSSSCPEDKMM